MLTVEKPNKLQRVFRFFIFSTALVLAIYTDRLLVDIKAHQYPLFHIYLRFFFIFWVLSSVIISLFGETRKIGGLRSFLISLFNPALGLIMVMASESKKELAVNVLDQDLKQHNTARNNKAYSLNN